MDPKGWSFIEQAGRVRCIVYVLAMVSASLFTLSCSTENRIPGYIYFRLNANPTTLDPAHIVDVTGGSIAAKLFNGLVRCGDDLGISPDIADAWTISDDGLSYTFSLRRGISFANGRETTARDFKYSFQRILNPTTMSPNTWVLDKIRGAVDFMKGEKDEVEGIQVIDRYTLRITLERPFAPFLNLLAMTAAYVVPEEDIDRWGPDFSSHASGTGPFIIEEWVPNTVIRLGRRTDYFNDPAEVRGIVYRIIPEDLTAVTEYEIGNLDVITLPASEFRRFMEDTERRPLISSLPGLNTYYLGLNCSRYPLSNRNLRRALNYAIDTPRILETLYEGRGRPAEGPLPDILRKWPLNSPYEFDPEKAKRILAQEHMQQMRLRFYITADQEVVDLAEVIQQYLEDVGIHADIRQLEWSAFKEAVSRGDADIFYLSWWADYADPENFLFPLFHSLNHGSAGNRTRYTNTEVDMLIEKGQHTMEQHERLLYYRKAEQMIIEDAPCVFMWHRTDFTARQPWISHYRLYPVYSMDKGTEIRLMEDSFTREKQAS
jgi:peptide/nickel transport system substrate-binding protein/oligopeptide transport system substrate-binding protein